MFERDKHCYSNHVICCDWPHSSFAVLQRSGLVHKGRFNFYLCLDFACLDYDHKYLFLHSCGLLTRVNHDRTKVKHDCCFLLEWFKKARWFKLSGITYSACLHLNSQLGMRSPTTSNPQEVLMIYQLLIR